PEYEYEYEIESVVNYLNKKASTDYKTKTKATRDLVVVRLKDGYTVDQFKTVIDNKTKDWLTAPDMVKYLRPETLFGNKFEGYLNQIDAVFEQPVSKAATAINSHLNYMQKRHGQ
ncbi:conserved phage C-terminal domain-containing protein, partial [Mucilaginibacter sp. 5B2]|nr:conserved phage C-terminal domain-containing protein [Mucilaginibacter sp. 5B2]